MKIITDSITLDELKQIAAELLGNTVKAVVDIDKKAVAVDAELHSDLEALLLQSGSKQKNLWGINPYPEAPDNELIEFDSMTNMQPSQGSRSRSVEMKRYVKNYRNCFKTD